MVQPPSPPLEALRVDLAALRRRSIDRHELEVALEVPWLVEVLSNTDAEVGNAAAVSLQVLLQPEGVVLVQGALSLAFTVPCGRCLADAAVDGRGEIFATFMPASPSDVPAGDDEDDDDDEGAQDLWRYDGPVLRLDGLVAEQVALAYPMRALCARGEACRGLCSNCGHELNTVPDVVRQCPKCRNEVPLTPVANRSPSAEEPQRDERGDSPLAAALRKLDLE
ncbi:MAG: DUF177 domain-containing protein [Deltaproteobacteria bacterium]|nr:DUF177 domain-containing protein [Deltaproteobacteria bacterium]